MYLCTLRVRFVCLGGFIALFGVSVKAANRQKEKKSQLAKSKTHHRMMVRFY